MEFNKIVIVQLKKIKLLTMMEQPPHPKNLKYLKVTYLRSNAIKL
jgi:hypothetical protein